MMSLGPPSSGRSGTRMTRTGRRTTRSSSRSPPGTPTTPSLRYGETGGRSPDLAKCATSCRWIHEKGEYKQVAFKEAMIDHLELESSITLATSGHTNMGRAEPEQSTKQVAAATTGEEGDSIKRANHFAFIERATQTKVFEATECECQTDPPPM